MSFKVILTQPLCKEGMDLLAEKRADIFIANSSDISAYQKKLSSADAVIIRIGQMSRKDMDMAPNLKVIGRTGIGYDSVDIAAANERGIPVVITPGANIRSVAEHTLGLIFALTKNLNESINETQSGNFNIRNSGKSIELLGKRIGFAGLGNIGDAVAKMCQALGMKILAYDPFFTPENLSSRGYIPYQNICTMLEEADIVTVHMPLVEQTRNLIAEEELGHMKKTAFLLNCSRGGIVNENDLLNALQSDQIAGAALDVLCQEPPAADHPLLHAKNVIVTPHMAGLTREASAKVAIMAIEGCWQVLEGIPCPHVASRACYDHPIWKGQGHCKTKNALA